MGKHKPKLQSHHLYLGAGGMLAVAALIIALTFGLSNAQMSSAEMQSACTSAGGTWDGSTCIMPSTPPPPSPSPTPSPSSADMASQCASAGGSWNGSTCIMPSPSPTPSPTPSPSPATTTQCDWTVQYMKANQTCQPRSDCTNTAHADYNTSECQGVRNASSNTTTRPAANLVTCPSLQNRQVTPEECEAATPVCQAGQTTSSTSPCKTSSTERFFCSALNREATSAECGAATPECTTGQTPERDHCRPAYGYRDTQPQPISSDMLLCKDPRDQNIMQRYPKEFSTWDPVTKQQVKKVMNSCEDWYEQMKDQFQGHGDFEERTKDVVKDVKDYLKDVKIEGDLSDEIRTLKFEAVVKDKNNPVECNQSGGPGINPGPFPSLGQARPSFVRPVECDVIEAERQIREISLASGISCPLSGSVQQIVDQVKPDFDFIRDLNASSTIDEVKEGHARFQRARAALEKLNGSWDDATQTSKPGILQGLNSCRDLGFLTRDAQRMLEDFKYLSDTDEYKELAGFTSNPLAYLPAGVDIFALWEPDQDACFDEDFGGGRIGDPVPMGGIGDPRSYGKNAVLNVGDDEFDEDFDEGFEDEGDFDKEEMGGSYCGDFGDNEEFMPKAECMPPVMRYLGMGVLRDLRKALTQKGCEAQGERTSQFACEGFKLAPVELAKNGKKLPNEVRAIVDELVQEGIMHCDAGENEEAAKVFRALMKTVMPFMHGRGSRIGFGDMKKNAIDQLKERGVVTEDDAKDIDALEKEIDTLKDQLAVMESKYQELLFAKVQLERGLGKARETLKTLDLASEHFARLQENNATMQLGRKLTEVNEKAMALVYSIIEALPEGAAACKRNIGEALDVTFRGMSASGSDAVIQALDGLYAKITSGALTAEEVVSACEGLKRQFVALGGSEAELEAARQEGVIAFKDTPLSHWAGSFALIAVNSNLAAASNENVGVGNSEMYAQAIVRAVRLAAMADPEKLGKKLGEYLALSDEAKSSIALAKDVPGLSSVGWARPFVAVCQEFGVKECSDLPVKSLTDTVTRAQMAGLLVHLLDAAKLVRPSTADVAAPADSVAHSYLEEIKVVKAMGIMGGCSGPSDVNFCPDQAMSVGMDLVAAVNCSNYIGSVRKPVVTPEE